MGLSYCAMSGRASRRRPARCTTTSPRRLLRLASNARSFVIAELQEVVLQSLQRIPLFVEVVPQVIRFLEYVLTVVDHALTDEGRHAESSQRRSPSSAQVMRHEWIDAVR